MTTHQQTRKVRIGDVTIGGGSPIAIQSMLNVSPRDVEGNVAQALALQQAGCEIVRVAIPDQDAVALVGPLKRALSIPLVVDIHFDYRLALACVEAGADKVRINPGNIGSDERVKAVADACRRKGVPIRIGVNSGSVEKQLLEKYGSPTAEALCESALSHVRLLERFDFDQIVIAVKSSDVRTMVETNRLLAQQVDYPLHLGVTEAGTPRMGVIRSSAGIGSLLLDGIGDTIRISLTADPVEEVRAAKDLLRGLGLYGKGARLISCPTCGRTRINLIALAEQVERMLEDVDKDITVAVMGCAVNGPGEAREADVGIAGGDGEGLLFRKGQVIRKVPETALVQELKREIDLL